MSSRDYLLLGSPQTSGRHTCREVVDTLEEGSLLIHLHGRCVSHILTSLTLTPAGRRLGHTHHTIGEIESRTPALTGREEETYPRTLTQTLSLCSCIHSHTHLFHTYSTLFLSLSLSLSLSLARSLSLSTAVAGQYCLGIRDGGTAGGSGQSSLAFSLDI